MASAATLRDLRVERMSSLLDGLSPLELVDELEVVGAPIEGEEVGTPASQLGYTTSQAELASQAELDGRRLQGVSEAIERDRQCTAPEMLRLHANYCQALGNEVLATNALTRLFPSWRSLQVLEVAPTLKRCPTRCQHHTPQLMRNPILTRTLHAPPELSQVAGCAPLVAGLVRLDAASLGSLTQLDASDSRSSDDLLRFAAFIAPLQRLDASHNPAITDVGVRALRAHPHTRRTLHTLRLQKATGLTAHALPALSELRGLHTLDLDGTVISAQQQAALRVYARAAARAKYAEQARGNLQRRIAAEARQYGEEMARAAQPHRYCAADMLRLRDVPFSRVPPRPLPTIPGVIKQ